MKGAVFRSSEFPAAKKKKRIADVIPATYVRQARCLGSCTGVWESRAVQLNSIVLMLTTFFICLYSVLKNMSGNMSGFSSLWCHKKRQKNVFIQWQVGVARTWNTPSLLTSNIWMSHTVAPGDCVPSLHKTWTMTIILRQSRKHCLAAYIPQGTQMCINPPLEIVPHQANNVRSLFLNNDMIYCCESLLKIYIFSRTQWAWGLSGPDREGIKSVLIP